MCNLREMISAAWGSKSSSWKSYLFTASTILPLMDLSMNDINMYGDYLVVKNDMKSSLIS